MKKKRIIISIILLMVLVSFAIGNCGIDAGELSQVNLKDLEISVDYDANASITLERTGDTSNSITAYYRTINGSGVAGTHYTAKTGTVTFSAGETSETITIDTLAFNTYEQENRFFYVEIYKVEGNGIKDYDQDICKVTINHSDSITTNGLNTWYVLYQDSSNHHYESNSTYTTPIQDITHYNYWKTIGSSLKGKFGADISTNATNIRLYILASNNSDGSSSVNQSTYYGSEDGDYASGELNVTDYSYIYGKGEVKDAGGLQDDGDIDKGFVSIYVTDTTRPTIQSFYVVGNTSEAYSDGDDLFISVGFNEIVTVSGGSPSLPIKYSDGSVTYASYVGGSGTDTLVFKLTISKEKSSTGLYIYNPSDSDSFIGEEYIQDIAGNTMSAYSNTACINANIIIENVVPTISDMTADKSNVSLNYGDTVGITLEFSEAVVITGEPILNLNNGMTATMTSGTGGYVLSCDFSYSIGTTENASQLYVTSITGGTIVDYSGNSLTRTIDTTNIKTNNICVDNIDPVISLSQNGNGTYATSQSTKMYISDIDGSLVESVKYIWNTIGTTPSDASFTETGGNNVETTISGLTGSRYLHIMATDVAGNVSYYNSAVFHLDNQAPTITIDNNGGAFATEHTVEVSLTDSHSGIGSDFKYIWSTSTTTPSDADFNAGSSGTVNTDITKNTGNGTYYLYIRATDNGGNNGYFKSSAFAFDNTAPDEIQITNSESGDSYRRNYDISMTATDTNGLYTDSSIESIRYQWMDTATQSADLTTGFTTYSGEINYNNDGATGIKYLHVIAEDVAGNTLYETFPYTFDYDVPNITVTSDDLTGTHRSITAQVEVSDVYNDIGTFKYIWREDMTEDSVTGTFISADTTGKTGIGNPLKNDSSGSYYLHVYCEDSAGNASYSVTGPYVLDREVPTGSITIAENEINSGSITLNLVASDNYQGSNLYYALSQDGQVTWSDWTSFPNLITLNNYQLNDISEGITTVSVKFKDLAGNESEIYSDTVSVDLTAPTASIIYSPEESQGWTNEDVVASLTELVDNSGGTVITPNGESYQFTANGSYTFEIQDSLGNSATLGANVTWIDKIDPVIAQVPGNQTPSKAHEGVISVTDNITNESEIAIYYQWTTSQTAPEIEEANWIETANGVTIDKNSVNGEWYLHIKALDEAGNSSIATSGKYIFDNTAPTGTVTIVETVTETNLITINLECQDAYSNESEITYGISEDNINYGPYTSFSSVIKDYETTNGEGEHTLYVKFKDKLGNESDAFTDSFIIDQTPPSGTIVYSIDGTNGLTNENVTATLTALTDNYTESGQITVNDMTYEFLENGDYIFTLSDQAGNETQMTASVDWIDKTDPTITLTPNTDQTPRLSQSTVINVTDNKTAATDIDVFYQWSTSEITPELEDVNWLAIENNNEVNLADLSGNYYLHIKAIDEPGNTSYHTSGKFVLDNEAPTGSFNIEETMIKTNKINLELSATDNVTQTGALQFALSTDGITWSEYTVMTSQVANYEIENIEGVTTLYVKYQDALTNESPIYSDSVILDLTAPSGSLVYSDLAADGYVNTDVTVTLTDITDNYSALNDITVSALSYVFKTNGSYEFTLTDEVGNVETLQAVVTCIDKEGPTIQGLSGNLNPAKSQSAFISATDNTTASSDLVLQYQWHESDSQLEETDLGWIEVTNNTIVTKEGVDGDWYLHIQGSDTAGNVSNYISSKYVFDNTAPMGSLSYSTENRTAQPVTATLTANETITVLNPSDGSNKVVFYDNGEYEFEFADVAGNTSTAWASVDWIDTDLPSANVETSTTSWTNEDLILTVWVESDSRISIEEFDFGTIDDYSLTNTTTRALETALGTDEYTDYKAYRIGENGTLVFEILDVDTLLSQEIEVTIDNIDKVNPEYVLALSEEGPTMKDIIVNISTTDNSNTAVEIIAPEDVTGSNGQYTVSENGEYDFTIRDMAGNEVSIPISISNIDREVENLEVIYSETDWTNQDVTATVTSTEEIEVVNNNGDEDYIFTKNGSFEFEVKDVAGNISYTTAAALKIDKTLPDAEITYSPTEITNTDVVLSIVGDEPITVTSAENLEQVANETDQFIVEENGSYQFTLVDRGGNEKIKTINIQNIDKTPVDITYTLSTNEMTNEPVQIFLQGNESFEVITVPEGIQKVVTDDDTKYYALESDDYTFILTDDAGNLTTKVVSITNIDKVAPVLSLAYSETDWTYEDVVITLSADEEITVLNNNNSKTKTLTQNGEFEFFVIDRAGNESSMIASVNNIDKDAPKASGVYTPNTMVNTDVILQIVSNEIVTLESLDNLALVSGTTDEFVVEINGTYQFKLTDRAGNETIKTIEIKNIDKESPVITFALSTEDDTNQPVEIYLTGDEAFTVTVVPEGISTVTVDGTVKYYANISGEYLFQVVDSYGNTGDNTLVIDNIDLISPTLSITLSETTWTNENVVATLLADEEIVVLNNNNSSEYTFVQNGEFTFYVEDRAGNTASLKATVAIIDKNKPTGTFEYTTTEMTNEDLKVTILGNEPLSQVTSSENLEIIESTGVDSLASRTYKITENGTYHFTLTDLALNSTEYEIYISNIDKVPPVMTYTLIYDTPIGTKEVNELGEITKGPVVTSGDDSLSYQDSLITNSDVLLEFNGNESYTMVEIPDSVTIDSDGYYVLSENGTYSFISQDVAGNMTETEIVISTISKSTPEVTITYSETDWTKNDVIATVSSTTDDYIRVVNNYNSYSRTFTDNGEYTFIIQDYAGNEVYATATVNNIDRSSPVLSATYDKTTYTNDNVTVTISANETFTMLNNDGSNSYTFENNGEVKLVAQDLLGNRSEIVVGVDYIDKTAPEIVFTGQETLNLVVGQSIDLLEDVTTENYEDSQLAINYTTNLNKSIPGTYTVYYTVTDLAGNTGFKAREIIVIGDELTMTFNGQILEDLLYLGGDSFNINLYNTSGEYEILYSQGKLTKGEMKIQGTLLEDETFEISESGWYTFLIMDQERHTGFYNLLITK
jgi:hypothetical protein